MTATTCTACKSLARMGVKCNQHRTEATSTRLIYTATKQGHVLSGTKGEQALQAERLLGARKTTMNGKH